MMQERGENFCSYVLSELEGLGSRVQVEGLALIGEQTVYQWRLAGS